MAESRENDPELKDRVQRLLGFLTELVKARSAPVRNVDKHKSFPLDFGNLDVGLRTDAESGDVVLRARRVHLEEPPTPPVAVSAWIVGDPADSSIEPKLAANAPHPEQFDTWLGTWRGWAVVDRERRPAAELHSFLQRAMLDLEAQPESLELVVASGLLHLSAGVAGEQISTHLITQGTVIERHEASGDLLVLLDAESGPTLEDTQLLTGLDVFDSSGTRSLHESLTTTVLSPVDPAVKIFLKDWADRALTIRVDVVDRPEDAQSTDRMITPSPMLVQRKRGAYALIEYYDRMSAAAGVDGAPVPLGLAQLVEAIEPHERLAWLDRDGTASSARLAEDPLFPLPANKEQRDIIDRLSGDSGVVVEGPPGTGKTHTIANLVSALLARGQRVLVTSEKAQALRVLRDKLPAELQELCVSVTDAARGGSAELNRSVSEIATRKAQFDPSRSFERIDVLTRQRDDALSRRASLTERIRQARASEMVPHTDIAPGYSGTASTVVRLVSRNRIRHDWLSGPLHAPAPVLSDLEFRTLLGLAQKTRPERRARRNQRFPSLGLPSLNELAQACQVVADGPGNGAAASSGLFGMLDGAAPDFLERVRERCVALQGAVTDVDNLDPAFRRIADDVLSCRIDYLWERTAQLRELFTVAYNADGFLGTTAVEPPVVGRHALQAYDALATAFEGGEVWRSGLARLRRSKEQTAVETLGPIATVDGVEATTAPQVRAVAEHVRALDALQSVANLLREVGVELDTTGSRSQVVGNAARAVRSRDILDALKACAVDVVAVLREVRPDAPAIVTVDLARTVAASAQTIAAARAAEENHRWLRGAADHVRGLTAQGTPPEATALAEALDAAEFAGIRAALDNWNGAEIEHHEELHLAALHTRLDDAAPAFAQRIAGNPSSPEWSAVLEHVEGAWAWRRAEDWVQRYARGLSSEHLERELDAAEKDVAQLTARLAAERAWHGCLERTTTEQVQALQSYRSHIASLGKGTGKHAERYRVVARSAMQVAQGAVPAWVMPLQQVLSSIPPEQNSFDVVIVDEASQADIASLFLLWLAPRVIVVGDDKQCTPSDVTSGALDGVFSRLDSYLPDIPDYLRTGFTPRSSVFSLLRSRFGSVIRLREHFRCMPEIINWSSSQFYSDAPLVPVRQFGADRLPPLRTTYVEGGVVTGKYASLANRVEAEAIADAVQRCLADEAYDGKTFGIVVLQGQAQVDVITNELLDRLTPDQWEERRLRVGTPPDFQGDERHVVFLSMVVAPEQNIMALTKTDFQQRFNVAASRAQDQLWLFHSRTTDSLRSIDLRHSLLTYMQSTSPAAAEPMPEGVTHDERHRAFDSLFEQRVYLDIVARGYHVNPQVDANGRRIDLVVTGAKGKLAVECDGDHWHSSPEQQRADLERERELQRCGWRFWRIRESEYYLDPVGSMAGLWDELAKRGIGPSVGGIADVAHAGSVRWEPIDLDESPVADVVDVVEDEVVEQLLPVADTPSILESVVEPHLPVPAPRTEPIPAIEVPEVATPESASTSLSDAIIEVLASDRLQASKIAARVKEDYKVVQAELDRLVVAGRVARVKGLHTLALYHVVDGDERVEDVVQQVVVVEPEVRPAPIEAEVPSHAIGPLVEESESEPDGRTLADSILAMLAREPQIFSELSARIDAHWMDVHAELGRLVVEGRLREVTPAKGLTEFHVVDALEDFGTVEPPRTEEPPQPEPTVPEPRARVLVIDGWETLPPEAVDSLPPSLASRIIEQLSRGPVALSDLEFRLDEPRDRIEAVVEEMIAQGRVVWLPERGARVYGLAELVPASESAAVVDNVTRTVTIAELPPGKHDSIALSLVAGAAIADLTVERAMKMSRLNREQALLVLAELESEGRLVRGTSGPELTWRRAER